MSKQILSEKEIYEIQEIQKKKSYVEILDEREKHDIQKIDDYVRMYLKASLKNSLCLDDNKPSFPPMELDFETNTEVALKKYHEDLKEVPSIEDFFDNNSYFSDQDKFFYKAFYHRGLSYFEEGIEEIPNWLYVIRDEIEKTGDFFNEHLFDKLVFYMVRNNYNIDYSGLSFSERRILSIGFNADFDGDDILHLNDKEEEKKSSHTPADIEFMKNNIIQIARKKYDEDGKKNKQNSPPKIMKNRKPVKNKFKKNKR